MPRDKGPGLKALGSKARVQRARFEGIGFKAKVERPRLEG